MDFSALIPVLKENTRQLMAAASPSGFTRQAVTVAQTIARAMGYETRVSRKGNLSLRL